MLIIGKTGTGKTELAKLIAPIFGFRFHRIDGSGEQLPSDIIGYEDIRTGEIRKGPIFGADEVLVDEKNRLSPRTRSVLLQPMAEGTVTILDMTFKLDPGFLVIATENPASYGDAAPLRLQEKDRFALSFYSDWPTHEERVAIMDVNLRPSSQKHIPEKLCEKEDILSLQENIASSIYIDRSMLEYAAYVTDQLTPTFSNLESVKSKEDVRDTPPVRGGNDLVIASRSYAFLLNDKYVMPSHIRWVARLALPHRIDAHSPEFSWSERQRLIQMAIKQADKEMRWGQSGH
jgi:MoxR-like ATPase